MESVNTNTSKTFRILSLDGGGVRGIIEAVLLSRIVKDYPNFLHGIDLIAGTSAGGIIAAALASGMPPDELVTFFSNGVSQVFAQSIYRRVFSMDNAIDAAYNPTALREMLAQVVGDKSLKDLERKVFFPTFKLDADVDSSNMRENAQAAKPISRWHPEFLHNLPNSRSAETLVIDAVLRTTAAPTYFPIYQGCIDGGVVANNPCLAATSAVMQHYDLRLVNIVVLSISTGSNPRGIQNTGTGNWGLVEWGPHIIELLLDSSTEAIDYQTRCLLKDRYHRLDPLLPKNISLDDCSALSDLIQTANEVDLTETKKWIDQFWNIEAPPSQSVTQLPSTNAPANGWQCSIQ